MSEWKAHPMFSHYKFSSDGEVIGLSRGKPRKLIGTLCGIGYRAIDFKVGGKTMKREYIHRVVCDLFNGPQPEWSQCCRHLDGDKTNNAASNLAWGTDKENSDDKVLHGTMGFGEKNPMAILTREKVDEMRSIREIENKPYYKLAKDFGVSTMTAFRAVTLRTWK